MQTAILSMLIGISFVALIRFALHHESRDGSARRMRFVLGIMIGLLAAFAVLVTRTDLIPDNIERGLSLAMVIVLAAVTGFLAWYVRGI